MTSKQRSQSWVTPKWWGLGFGLIFGCNPAASSSLDAGLATSPNPNEPGRPDGGPTLDTPDLDTPDAAVTSVTSDVPSSSDAPAQTGANFGLPEFGDDAGAPVPSIGAPASGAPSSGAPSSAGPDVDAGPAPDCGPCPIPLDGCVAYVCNPVSGACEPMPNLGAACDDGNACTTEDACGANAECVGTAVSCEANANPCVVNECNPQSGQCEPRALPPSSACDDGNGCTVDDSCDEAGACGGREKDCSALTGTCLIGTCNLTSGECEALPGPEGEQCDDDDPCTIDDQCDVTGNCAGSAKDCSHYDDKCTTGACDPKSGECQKLNVEDGLPCDDLTSCTTNDVCKAGTCGGLVPDTCSSGGTLDVSSGSASVTLDTSCPTVSDQFNVANYKNLPLPLPDADADASAGDCSQSTGPDVYLLLDLSAYTTKVRLEATTDRENTLFDTVLILMGTTPDADGQQCGYEALAACNDDISRDKKQSRLDVVVEPGHYVLVVDGFLSTKEGLVDLTVNVTPQ